MNGSSLPLESVRNFVPNLSHIPDAALVQVGESGPGRILQGSNQASRTLEMGLCAGVTSRENRDMRRCLTPDSRIRSALQKETHADANLCWTCSTCDSECPISRATNRLRPQKIVRMANLGFLDDLLTLPEIWYCLTCRRCHDVCPNSVKACTIIEFLRKEAIRRKVVSWDAFSRYKRFVARFQRVRWHAVQHCLRSRTEPISPEIWNRWLETPSDASRSEIRLTELSPSQVFRSAAGNARTPSCLTCGECSSFCPVFSERSVFDPQWIFRMVNLGMEDEILRSPSIWLCIGCQRCTEACGEQVTGHLVIQRLQEQALKEGVVDHAFPFRWKAAQKAIYTPFINRINSILGFPQG